MNRDDWTPSRFSVLCINHFEERHIDRTGKCITLQEEAVPTIFSSADDSQNEKHVQVSNEDSKGSTRSKRVRSSHVKVLKTRDKVLAPETVTATVETQEPDQEEEEEEEEECTPEGEAETAERWSIIVDEELMKIDSFPHFFHGNYCVSQDIQWAPHDNPSKEAKDPTNVIEVKESWQWLGLDVRGPLPKTSGGHKYVLSVADYFSKWVEAWPMESHLPENIVKHIVEIVNHFGFPLRILSRLPLETINKINKQLKTEMKVRVALVVYHHQTGSVDMTTQQMIDRMVNELVEEHPSDWDIYLPAKVFSLCFKEHATTKERPFTLLCCKEVEPVHSPRELEMTDKDIKESDFVVS